MTFISRGSLAAIALMFVAMSLTVNAVTPMVSAGDEHVLALRSDGKVFAWGSDLDGRLGTGRTIAFTRPVAVPGLSGMAKVATGFGHILVVARNGDLWTWGQNDFGQLGDGSRTDSTRPFRVPGMGPIVSVCGGQLHSAALGQDGSVWMWGAGGFGQIGDGTTNDAVRPKLVPGLAQITSIQCGDHHMLALQSDGSVWSWGYNPDGELGDGTTVNRNRPARIAGLANVASIAASSYASMALTRDGTVLWWGARLQLVPLARTDLSNRVSAIFGANGGGTFVAIGLDRQQWWLSGFGATTAMLGPTIGSLDSIAFSSFHTLLLRTDGSLLSYGINNYGQLGTGNFVRESTPTLVSGIANVVSAAANQSNSVAVDRSGNVYVWGSDARGQMGSGQENLRSTLPREVVGLPSVVQVSAGRDHSMALDSAGNVWAWGNGVNGVIGDGSGVLYDGSEASRSIPTRVPTLTSAVAIAAGATKSQALLADGSVWAWGLDPGDGSFTSNKPLRVAGLNNAVAISASGARFAVLQDGTLWGWAQNNLGQIGLGRADTTNVARPTQVLGLSKVRTVFAGYFGTYAIMNDGSVSAWGQGALGNADVLASLVPVRISLPTNVAEIAVARGGGNSVLARMDDGSIWGWGANLQGELGGSDPAVIGGSRVPRRVPSLNGIAGIATGWTGFTPDSGFSALLRRDGYVMSAGINRSGQIGDGTLANRRAFVLTVNPAATGFLNLDTSLNVEAPGSLAVPFFVASAGTVGDANVNVSTQLFPTQSDASTTQSAYVFALAPSSLVKGAALKGGADIDDPAYRINLKATPAAGVAVDPKDGPLGCVLAQLNSSGQLTAVSASNLQAYVTGVLSAGGTAVNVLNNISADAIKGSTFYVGYGPTGSAMINNGVNRSVVTVPGTQNCLPQAPQTGWWWDPTQPDRGYGIEVRGNKLQWLSFVNNPSGIPSWTVASGPTALDGSLFQATQYSYAGGQTLNGNYVTPTGPKNEGLLTLSFATATQGTILWPNGTRNVQRQEFIPAGLTTSPSATQPETGWWWNTAEPYRGYFIEWQNGYASVTGYMYDDTGKPVWYQSLSATADPRSYTGAWWMFGNGYPFTPNGKTINPKRTRLSDNFAALSIRFSDSANATLTLPTGRQIPITRLRF